MYKIFLIVAVYLCVQPFAQADFRSTYSTPPDYSLKITASNHVTTSDISKEISFGNKHYFDEAYDIMIDLILKKAKSNSRSHHSNSEIIKNIGYNNTSFGLGVSRHRVRLKVKFRF